MFWKKKKSEPSAGLTKSSKGGFGGESAAPEEEPGLHWQNINDPVVVGNSLIWFDEFESLNFEASGAKELHKVHGDFISVINRTLDAVLERNNDPDTAEFVLRRKAIASEYNPHIFPEMEFSPRDLESVAIRESKLGKGLLAVLDKVGIDYYDITSLDESEDSPGVWLRWNDTDSGFLNLQFLKVFKDKTGKEFAYWYTHLLASNRPIDYRYIAQSKGGDPFFSMDMGQSSSPEGQYNMKWALPSLLKTVAFLAETPFPSSAGMIGLSRDLAFGGVSAEARPRPAFGVVRDEIFAFTHDLDDWEVQGIKPPHTVLFGWTITQDSVEEFSKILPVISSGCSLALNLFEEAEQEFVGLFTGMDWDMQLRQPAALASVIPDEYGHRFPGEWMTIPEYSRRNAHVTNNYNEVYNSPSSLGRREGFVDLLENGADRYVLHAANSLVFGEFLNSVTTSEEELETALEILSMAFSLDPDDEFEDGQATNAMSNGGVLYYQAGKLDLAEKMLQWALDRGSGEGHFGSSDEANFVLSLVYEELGESDKAEEYRELSEELGGYNSASKLRRPGVSPIKASGSAIGRKFCTNCGQAFLKTDQKFCSGCGTKR